MSAPFERRGSLAGLPIAAALAACVPASSPIDPRGRDARADATIDARMIGALDASAIDPDAGAADARAGDAGRAAPLGLDAAWWEGAVIYFVLTDRFANGDPSNDGSNACTDPANPMAYHGGDFQGLIDRLDYLEELGVDALWITPVPVQVGCGYHGYWADLDDPDEGLVEPRLGGAEGLDRLLAALHARGIRLVIDHVVNHSGRGARIVTTHPEWFHPDHPACEALGDPTVTCPLQGLPDFAQERPDVAAYLDALSVALVRRFEPDGLRIDTVKHVAPSYFRDRWVPAVLGERPSLYLLGEHFDESGYGPQEPYLAAGMHGFFDFPLRRALIDSLARGASIDGVARRVREAVDQLGVERARLRSSFLDNHDVPRFLEEMGGWPVDEQRARYHLALAILFTTPGIPQILYGDELGMRGTHPENRRDMPAWAWDPATRGGSPLGYLPDPGRTHRWLRRLIALRRETPALGHGGYVELWRPGGTGVEVWAFLRSAGESRAIVTFNAGAIEVRARSMRLRDNPHTRPEDAAAFPDGVELVDRLGEHPGATARVEGGDLIVDLPPRSLAVWTVRAAAP